MIQRYKDIKFHDKHIRLCLTMDVLLNIQEDYKCLLSNLFEEVDEREKYEREQAFLVMLSLEGQRITERDEQIDSLSYADFKYLQPWEREDLINAMWSAIAMGFQRDYEDAEVDETLLEIKKKKTGILQKVMHLIQLKRLGSHSGNT